MKTNLIEVMADYLEHEGKTNAFFEDHHALKISEIAKLAGLSPSLVRQYASGMKQASAPQVKKIESAIHKLAQSLLQLQLI